jgi:hypothetical protein
MCFGNLSPIATRISSSIFPFRSLPAANTEVANLRNVPGRPGTQSETASASPRWGRFFGGLLCKLHPMGRFLLIRKLRTPTAREPLRRAGTVETEVR